jgi:hypothetical protein
MRHTVISPLSPRVCRSRGQLTKLSRNNEVRVRKGVNYANISLSLARNLMPGVRQYIIFFIENLYRPEKGLIEA